MARSLRVEYAGARYHIMCRGNQSRQIFEKDEDADLFVRTLGEVCVRNQVVVHAWCLLRYRFPVSVAWTSQTLSMGHYTTVSRAMRFFDNPDEEWMSDKRAVLILTG